MTRSNTSSSPPTATSSPYFPWLLLVSLLGILFLLGTFANWRSSGVGPQVQVPMFYDAHYLFPRPWTQEQSAPGVPDPAPVAIFGGNSVSQSFMAGSDNLSRVSFLLSGPEGGLVTAVLTDEFGGSWQAEIPLSSAADRQEYSLSFPADPGSKGQTFNITLSAPQASANQPVIAYAVGGDRLGDSLRLNEFIRPGNLAITTYSKGAPGLWWFDALGEQILPAQFRLRLQQYKPPPFKGDIFSWLLVITIGLSAALLVLASPGLQSREILFWRKLAYISGWFLVILFGSLLVWQIGSGRVQIVADSNDIMAVQDSKVGTAPTANPRLAADLISDLWTAERVPEARYVHTDVDPYPAIAVPGDSRVEYSLIIPPGSRLRFAQAAEGSGSIDFVVKVNDDSLFEEEVLAQDESTPKKLSWQEVDLNPWTGQGVVLVFETSQKDGPARGLWYMPQIETDASWILADPPDAYLPVQVRFGDTAELLGVVLDETLLQSDGQLGVQLLWRPLQKNTRQGKVFVHLLNGENQLIAQHDAPPVQGAYPFNLWQPGSIIQDVHMLQVDADALNSGPYRLAIGVYDPQTLERWTAENAGGSLVESAAAVVALPSEVLP